MIACEASQKVCIAFRSLGYNAFSCDVEPCYGGHPEWHIQTDVRKVLNQQRLGNSCFYAIAFQTCDGTYHAYNSWDLIIAHPPCTYLTVTGNRWFNETRYGNKAKERKKERELAARFFMEFVNAPCNHIAIENPIGYMSTYYRKPDQIIHPYMFGDPARKATCLWLKGLPKLVPTNIVEPKIIVYKNGKGTDNPWHMDTMKLPKNERARARSETFTGVALAMAQQWCNIKELIQ